MYIPATLTKKARTAEVVVQESHAAPELDAATAADGAMGLDPIQV